MTTQRMSQRDHFYKAGRIIAGGNETALELLFGFNPISDDELRAFIKRRPGVWSRFAGYLGTRVGDGAIYWGA